MRPTENTHPQYFTTIDGYVVHDGMYVWDYDLNVSRVSFERTFASEIMNEYWDGWFDMVSQDGERMPSMNASRMWVRHPNTNVTADRYSNTSR